MERTLQVRYAPPGAPARLYMLQVSPVTSVAQIKLELLVEFGIDLPLQKLMVPLLLLPTVTQLLQVGQYSSRR